MMSLGTNLEEDLMLLVIVATPLTKQTVQRAGGKDKVSLPLAGPLEEEQLHGVVVEGDLNLWRYCFLPLVVSAISTGTQEPANES